MLASQKTLKKCWPLFRPVTDNSNQSKLSASHI